MRSHQKLTQQRQSCRGTAAQRGRQWRSDGSAHRAHARSAARQQQRRQSQQRQQQGHDSHSQQYATGRVYLATCPLVGWESFADVLGTRFTPALHLHHYVVVEQLQGLPSCGSDSSSSGGSSLVAAYDFLPLDPTSPLTAATLLSGGAVQGGCGCGKPSTSPDGGRNERASRISNLRSLDHAALMLPALRSLPATQARRGAESSEVCRGSAASCRGSRTCQTHWQRQRPSSGGT